MNYLVAEKAFSVAAEQVKNDLKSASAIARQSGQFNPALFCENFAKQDYFTVPDIIDLIAFLQQTAFDRQFGEERDRLQGKPWMESHATEFVNLANTLGVISPLPPLFQHYCGVGIMGAASLRASDRINYFSKLNENTNKEEKITFDSIWAFTGNRELSKGLDEPAIVEAVAKHYDKPFQYIKKPVGKDIREFADGITETMMVKYLIQAKLPSDKIHLLDSDIQKEHWRATTQQNAVDIAPRILDLLEKGQLQPHAGDNAYHFMIIAEQPYAGRMARQVQRAFDAELKKRNAKSTVRIEGCGPGVTNTSTDTLTRLNSELAALGAERFIDARIKLKNANIPELRDPKIIMFSLRDDYYLQQQKKQLPLEEKKVSAENLVKLSIFFDAEDKLKISFEAAAPDQDCKHKLP